MPLERLASETFTGIGAVSKHLARIVGQCFRAYSAIVDIGGCDRKLLEQDRIGIGSDMGLEAENSRFSLVFDPARIIIFCDAEAMRYRTKR